MAAPRTILLDVHASVRVGRANVTLKDNTRLVARKALSVGTLVVREEPCIVISDQVSMDMLLEAVGSYRNHAFMKRYQTLCYEGVDEDDIFVDRFDRNAFADENASRLFILASKFNHSCYPNARAVMDIDTGIMSVYATRAVAKGDEICVSYAPPSLMLLAKEERATGLRKFTCTCDLCTDKVQPSDAERAVALRGPQD